MLLFYFLPNININTKIPQFWPGNAADLLYEMNGFGAASWTGHQWCGTASLVSHYNDQLHQGHIPDTIRNAPLI